MDGKAGKIMKDRKSEHVRFKTQKKLFAREREKERERERGSVLKEWEEVWCNVCQEQNILG